jgi:hypothetical protein
LGLKAVETLKKNKVFKPKTFFFKEESKKRRRKRAPKSVTLSVIRWMQKEKA